MTVARDHLRRGGLAGQPEALAGDALHLRVAAAVDADRAGELSDPDPLQRPHEPMPVALQLERPAGQLRPERDRLGMDAVRTADHGGVAVLVRAGPLPPRASARARRGRARPRPGPEGPEPCRGRPTTSARSAASDRRAPAPPGRRRRRRRGRAAFAPRSRRPAPASEPWHARRISASASPGTTPAAAQPSSAASSTSSHRASFPSSDQIAFMAGRE